jgi:hypothetical protein
MDHYFIHPTRTAATVRFSQGVKIKPSSSMWLLVIQGVLSVVFLRVLRFSSTPYLFITLLINVNKITYPYITHSLKSKFTTWPIHCKPHGRFEGWYYPVVTKTRLVQGGTCQGSLTGRVEVYVKGVGWGRVCDDNWGDNEALAACKSVGLTWVHKWWLCQIWCCCCCCEGPIRKPNIRKSGSKKGAGRVPSDPLFTKNFAAIRKSHIRIFGCKKVIFFCSKQHKCVDARPVIRKGN